MTDNDPTLVALLRYYHDCVAAQLDWSRALNVLDQRDATLLGLTLAQQRDLGADGRLAVGSEEARELAKRAAASGADVSLSLGALFLCGRLPARGDKRPRRICAPLLETPLTVQLDLSRAAAVIESEETELSINYGLLAELLGAADDDDRLAGLLGELSEITPDFPIADAEFADFFNGFLAVADELPIGARRPAAKGVRGDAGDAAHGDGTLRLCDFYPPRIADRDELLLLPAAAVVLGRRSGPAQTVLAELQAAAAMPLRQTALARLFRMAPAGRAAVGDLVDNDGGEERGAGEQGAGERGAAEPAAAAGLRLPLPMPLTETQRQVVLSARSEPLTVVTGPPGTGKSYTITAIVLDALQSGRSVLVASQMDKAVEVVVEQVERLAGESAVARSGGRAVQRALAKKLRRLTGPRAAATPDDGDWRTAAEEAEATEAELAAVERRLQEVVGQERQWSRLWRASERREPVCPLPIHDLGPRQVRRGAAALRRAVESDRPGAWWLTRWWGGYNARRARRSLQVPSEWECSLDELQELLEVQQLRQRRRALERRLPAPFPADLMWGEARQLFARRNEVALRQVRLARRRRLGETANDEVRRAQLRQLAALLRRRRHDLKRELRQGLDPHALLWGFPVWASTSRALSEVLPAEPGLFDLVVIDEASQCDPATAAAALLRGRRAVIVGDPQQLRHVCFLSRAREQAAVARCQLPAAAEQRFHFRRSLFDIAADAASQRRFFLLDEHFRSRPQIIDFSNRQFYAGRLRIMTSRPAAAAQQAIRVVPVAGSRSEGSSVNPAEVEAVIALLREAMSGPPPPLSLGVVSPFRDHVEAIRERVLGEFSAAEIDRHALVVGTAHSLQGDEKDLIVLSTSIDRESHPASLHFLQRPNLFNVAVTRARQQLQVVTSMDREALPGGLLRSFLEHAESPGRAAPAGPAGPAGPSGAADESRPLAAEAARRLSEHGLEVRPGFEAAGERIDLAVARAGRHLAVLLDDEQASHDALAVHRRLARAGWPVCRLPLRSWIADWTDCLRHIERTLEAT